MNQFPEHFVWGAACSSYQLEGAASIDGKGPSTWDVFSHRPGSTFMGHTGDVACDHYHKYKEDVALMKQLGLHAYRLSVCWPRVLADGTGKINEKGLAFYDRLIDELLAHNIQPWVTLFHWDYPYSLYLRGGWLNRESPAWFAEYASVVIDRLSDRVTHWMTINEPQIFLGPDHGDSTGAIGPMYRPTTRERLVAAHHTLMAHGRACQVIRARAKKKPSVGWAPIGRTYVPADDSPSSIAAARKCTLGFPTRDFWSNIWFADPILLGQYPEEAVRGFGEAMDFVKPGDLEQMKQPLDFYGLNIYDGIRVRARKPGSPALDVARIGNGLPGHATAMLYDDVEVVPAPPGHAQTAIRWFVVPSALYWGPKFIYERYKVPIVITENGLSNVDWVMSDGKVHDPQRIDYTRRYLKEYRRAAKDGTDIRGYFHWSIMDNCEWSSGYKERFGLIHVDFESLARTPKESFHWYKRVIATNGASLDEH